MSYIIKAIYNELSNYDIKPIENIEHHIMQKKLIIIINDDSFNFLAVCNYRMSRHNNKYKYYELISIIDLDDVKKIVLLILYNVYANSNKNLNENSNENSNEKSNENSNSETNNEILTFVKYNYKLVISIGSYDKNIEKVAQHMNLIYNLKTLIYPKLIQLDKQDYWMILFQIFNN